MIQYMPQRIRLGLVIGLGQEVYDHLRVAGRLEDVSDFLIRPPQQSRVDQVSIMGDRNLSAGERKQQRLTIFSRRRPGR